MEMRNDPPASQLVEYPSKGKATDSNTGFYLPDGSVLSPDAAYVSPETLKGLTKASLPGFLIFVRTLSSSCCRLLTVL